MPTQQAIAVFDDAGVFLGIQGDNPGEIYKIKTIENKWFGQVATACRTPNSSTLGASATQVMSRTRHFARESVTGNMRMAWPNWLTASNNGGLETGLGGQATLTASVLYKGTIYPCKWGGLNSVSVQDMSTTPLCDPINGLSIPEGDAFFVQTFYTNTAGIIYEGGGPGYESLDVSNGEVFRFALSGLTDQTSQTGALVGGSSSNNLRYGPIIIAADTSKPSLLILGSSVDMGFRSSANGGAFGDKGPMARAVGPSMAYSCAAQGGASSKHFLTPENRKLRMQLVPFFSDVYFGAPINDILVNNSSAEQLIADHQEVARLFDGKTVWTGTMTPDVSGAVTSADGSDQTPVATNGFSTKQPTYNNAVKANTLGSFDGWFDIASAMSLDNSNSQKWYANGTPNFSTPDLLHPGTNAEERVRQMGVVRTSVFQR